MLLVLLPILAGRKGDQASAAPAPTAGQLALLDAQGRPAALCPLRHTDVQADVSGFVGRVTVKQEFRNPAKEPMEAVYTFPLPNDAAVDDMTMTIGPRLIKGEIKRREEARQIYEAAKSAGQAAALLDQERPNIFTQSVANLMPGQDVTITISYVQLLRYDEGSYEFTFPMVVGPRFIAGSGGYTVPGRRGEPSPGRPVAPPQGTEGVVTDADKVTPPITPPRTRAGHDISLTVNLDAGLPIRDVRSELHQVEMDREGPARARIRLRDQESIPNKDFILRYGVAGEGIRTALLAHAPGTGSGYFTLIIQPPVAPPQQEVSPKEMVFVIDQTGSQEGWPIRKAKETMRYCLKQLSPDDTFQLVGFNTSLYPCFEAPVRNTPENLQRALKFLEPIEGDGGTDILQAVDYALKIPDDPGRLRMICYLTDGYVGNDMQILDYIRKHRGKARMFPFGIGNSVNRFLIDGMAREGRGAAEYVTLETPADGPASRFYQRVAKPLLLDPRVEWNGLPVADVYPEVLPDVFSSGPIIVKGRYKGAAQGEVTLSGRLRGRPWSQSIAVNLPAREPSGAALPTLWAREKIEALQSRDWLGAQSGSPSPNVQEQIVGLALDYRLMSQYTSFVAVEQRIVNVGGRQRTVDIPVEMPESVSYEGIFGEEAAERADGRPVSTLETNNPLATAMTAAIPARPNPFGLNSEMSRALGTGAADFESRNAPGRRNGDWYGDEFKARSSGSPGALPETSIIGGHPSGGAPAAPAPGAQPLPAVLDPALANREEPSPQAPMDLPPVAGVPGYGAGGRATRNRAPAAPALPPVTNPVPMRAPAARPALAEPMSPRRPAEAQSRLAPALRQRLAVSRERAKSKAPADAVEGRLDVQIWVQSLPADGVQRLKALGFELAAELRPGVLLLGTAPVEKLPDLARLPFVRWIEPPRYR